MALKSLNFSVITMDAHPHEEGVYRKLLKYLKNSKIDIDYIKPNVLRLDTFYELNKGSGVWHGSFSRRTEIETWSTPEGDPADKADIATINPKKLIPNLYKFPFIFIEEKHLLFVLTKNEEGKTLSIDPLAKSLSKALDSKIQDMGIDLTIVPRYDQEKMENVLNDYQVSSLRIKIQRPNGDGVKDVQDIFDDLEKSDAKTIDIHRSAQNGKRLKETPILKNQLRAATKCGEVEAHVDRIENGEIRVEKIKSTNFPKKGIFFRERNDKKPLYEAFYEKVVEMFIKL